MYAIIRAGGKQAKVRAGDLIEVERVKDAADTIEYQPILLVDDDGITHSGSEALAGAAVKARVIGETKGDKIDIFKYKNKSGYRRRMGHRQTYTQLEITGIEPPASSTKATTKKATTKKPATKKAPASAPAAAAAEDVPADAVSEEE